LGSGSTLATDFWMRRRGFPSSVHLFKVGKANRLHQHSSQKPTAHPESASATLISRSCRLFLSYRGSGEVIQRLALCQRTLERRAKVAWRVSPEMRFSTKPCPKLTCAAISGVQRPCSWQTPSESGGASTSMPQPAFDPGGRPYERCADAWNLVEGPPGVPSR
jgi:hypothetical protein